MEKTYYSQDSFREDRTQSLQSKGSTSAYPLQSQHTCNLITLNPAFWTFDFFLNMGHFSFPFSDLSHLVLLIFGA